MSPVHPEFEQILQGGDDYKLWMAVAQAIPARRKAAGENALTPLQVLVWRLWAGSGVIGNGGFWDQERYLDEWASAYAGAGIPEAERAIRSAPALMVRVRSGDEAAHSELRAVEKEFYRVNKGTRTVAAALIRRNSAEAFEGLVPLPPRQPLPPATSRSRLSPGTAKPGNFDADEFMRRVRESFPKRARDMMLRVANQIMADMGEAGAGLSFEFEDPVEGSPNVAGRLIVRGPEEAVKVFNARMRPTGR